MGYILMQNQKSQEIKCQDGEVLHPRRPSLERVGLF
jgi:hypothetical protein